MTQKYSALLVCALIASGIMAMATARVTAQEPAVIRPDLSGKWQLNRELSENAQAKLDRMQSSQGGHGPGRHLGGLFGGLFGGGHGAQMEQARELFLKAPSSFVVKQDSERIELTDSDGRVRVLTANGRKEKVNGRQVRTRWDKHLLVSEISLDNAKVTETYERLTNVQQLIVTTKLEMRGHDVRVRRVYEEERHDHQ